MLQQSRTPCTLERPKSALVQPIIVPFVGELFDFEISQQMFSVGSLFVLALFVHKPNAIESVLAAIVTDAESSTNLIPPIMGIALCTNQPNSRTWRDYLRYWFHIAV